MKTVQAEVNDIQKRNKIKVRVFYRNYKKIHSFYDTLKSHPPLNIEYSFPQPNKKYTYLLPIYRKFGNIPLVKKFATLFQKYFFERNKDDSFDLYHYAQMIPQKVPQKPFVIDFEHVSLLAGFEEKMDAKHLLGVLSHPNCKAIMAWSYAAVESLKLFLNKDYAQIETKVSVVYPALLLKDYIKSDHEIDYSIMDSNNFNILSVGIPYKKKGIIELVEAFKQLVTDKMDLHLYVISDLPAKIVNKYKAVKNLHIFKPTWSREDIVTKFFYPANLFVLPTKGDTFGMVFLEAMLTSTPVITTKQFAMNEIIDDGKTGYLIDSKMTFFSNGIIPSWKHINNVLNSGLDEKIVKQLVEKVERLYRDKELCSQMQVNALKKVESSFGLKERNSKLYKIYQLALNG
ncbi:MAG: hypothetical protein Fur003_2100 [Candidatus Dojkabacteria bacterium]